MKILSGSLIVAIILSATPCLAADCRIDYFNFVFGADAQTHSTVKSGTICSGSFKIRGGGINSISIKQQAQHGVVGMAGFNNWAYKSESGYVGPDSYVVEVTGETMGQRISRGTTDIHIEVDVVR